MTTIRKAATDLRVGDYFWINRELRRVTDVDALYVFGVSAIIDFDPVVVTITTSTSTVLAPPASTFDVEVFEEDPCAT